MYLMTKTPVSLTDTDDYARVALPSGPEDPQGMAAADSSDVESVIEDEDAQVMGFADLL